MVSEKNASEKQSVLKVGKLKLNKETVKNLRVSEAKKIKGGQKPQVSGQNACIATRFNCI